MAKIHETIIEKLVVELSSKKSLSSHKISALRELLKGNPKPRPDELIRIFTGDDGEIV